MARRSEAAKAAKAADGVTEAAATGGVADAAGGGADRLFRVPARNLWIKLDDIVTEKNHRLPDQADGVALRALADSIARDGLLQPIMVRRREDGKYLLIFGRRRLAATRLLGAATIDAAVISASLSDREVSRLRAVENLDRADLTPLEECAAVLQHFDAVKADAAACGQTLAEAEMHERVAEDLGRSATWVRDRAYLARLGTRAKAMLLAEELTLKAARKLAELADPRVGDEFLKRLADTPYRDSGAISRENPVRMSEVQRCVAEHLQSLETAPWKLELPVAGKPPCTECPHNSANALLLFEHEIAAAQDRGGRLRAGVCTMPACFEAKAKHAQHAIEQAAKRLTPSAVQAGEVPEIGVLEDHLPPTVKPTLAHEVRDRVAAQVREEVRRRKAGAASARAPGSGAKSGTKGVMKVQTSQAAERVTAAKHEAACQAWILRVARVIPFAAKRRPGARAMLALLVQSTLFEKLTDAEIRRGKPSPQSLAEVRRLLRPLRSPTLASIAAMERVAFKYGAFDELHERGCGDLIIAVASALGVKVPPRPRLEDFAPKAAPAGKVRTKKTTRTKGGAR